MSWYVFGSCVCLLGYLLLCFLVEFATCRFPFAWFWWCCFCLSFVVSFGWVGVSILFCCLVFCVCFVVWLAGWF